MTWNNHAQRVHGEHATPLGRQVGIIVAVGLCGAVAGASLTEALLAIFTHPSHLATLQPSANPLAIAGAIIGLIVALVLRGRILTTVAAPASAAPLDDDEFDDATDVLPLHPQSWFPIPTTQHPLPHPQAGDEPHTPQITTIPEVSTAMRIIPMRPQAGRPTLLVRRTQRMHGSEASREADTSSDTMPHPRAAAR